MPTDTQISIMCDIAKSAGADLTPEKAAALPDLVAKGLIEPAASDNTGNDRYKLTATGQKLLDDRGVGANEA